MTTKFISFELFKRFIFSFWNKIRVYIDKKVQQSSSTSQPQVAIEVDSNDRFFMTQDFEQYLSVCFFAYNKNFFYGQKLMIAPTGYIIKDSEFKGEKNYIQVCSILCSLEGNNGEVVISGMLFIDETYTGMNYLYRFLKDNSVWRSIDKQNF